jgi:hypothetical protein
MSRAIRGGLAILVCTACSERGGGGAPVPRDASSALDVTPGGEPGVIARFAGDQVRGRVVRGPAPLSVTVEVDDAPDDTSVTLRVELDSRIAAVPLTAPLVVTHRDAAPIRRDVDLTPAVRDAYLAVAATPVPGGDDDPQQADSIVWVATDRPAIGFVGRRGRLDHVDRVAIVDHANVVVHDRRTGVELARAPTGSGDAALAWLADQVGWCDECGARPPDPGQVQIVGDDDPRATATLLRSADGGAYVSVTVTGAPAGGVLRIGRASMRLDAYGDGVLDIDAAALLRATDRGAAARVPFVIEASGHPDRHGVTTVVLADQ